MTHPSASIYTPGHPSSTYTCTSSIIALQLLCLVFVNSHNLRLCSHSYTLSLMYTLFKFSLLFFTSPLSLPLLSFPLSPLSPFTPTLLPPSSHPSLTRPLTHPLTHSLTYSPTPSPLPLSPSRLTVCREGYASNDSQTYACIIGCNASTIDQMIPDRDRFYPTKTTTDQSGPTEGLLDSFRKQIPQLFVLSYDIAALQQHADRMMTLLPCNSVVYIENVSEG